MCIGVRSSDGLTAQPGAGAVCRVLWFRPRLRSCALTDAVAPGRGYGVKRGMLVPTENTASREEFCAVIDAGGVNPWWIAAIPFATRRPKSNES